MRRYESVKPESPPFGNGRRLCFTFKSDAPREDVTVQFREKSYFCRKTERKKGCVQCTGASLPLFLLVSKTRWHLSLRKMTLGLVSQFLLLRCRDCGAGASFHVRRDSP